MKRAFLVIMIVTGLMIGIVVTSGRSADVPRMTTDELKGMFGNPDLIIIDVRSGQDWIGSRVKIQGALREDPDKFESWAEKYSKDS